MLTLIALSPPRDRAAAAGQHGFALVKTLIIAAALLGLTMTALVYSRTDSLVSDNVVSGTKALLVATAGTEHGKGWLATNLINGTLPHDGLSLTLADGRYTANVDYYSYVGGVGQPGVYRITSSGTGVAGSLNGARRTVEEVVAAAYHGTALSVINISGDGTHAKICDTAGGSCSIPDYTIDGRNHDETGALANGGANPAPPPGCPAAVSGVFGTQTTPPTDFQTKLDDLKRRIAQKAIHECQANGNSNGNGNGSGGNGGGNTDCSSSTCTPGLCWVYTSGYDTNNYTGLDLSAPQLRATSKPAILGVNTPAAPNDRGPFMWDTPSINSDPPFIRTYDPGDPEITKLQTTIDDILNFALTSPVSDRECIAGDLSGVTRTYGTWDNPKIVIAANPNAQDPRAAALATSAPCPSGAGSNNTLNISNGSVIRGTGILIVPRAISLNDARFHWQGLVVILRDGDFRVSKVASAPAADQACGAILGAVILADVAGNDPKLSWIDVTSTTCSNPFSTDSSTATSYGFSANYSCSAISQAMGGNMRTLSWTERFAN